MTSSDIAQEVWKCTLEDGSTVWKYVHATNVATKTFTYYSFDGVTYTYSFIEFMTWADWINSEYNTDGFSVSPDGELIFEPFNDSAYVGTGSAAVSPSDLIDDGSIDGPYYEGRLY